MPQGEEQESRLVGGKSALCLRVCACAREARGKPISPTSSCFPSFMLSPEIDYFEQRKISRNQLLSGSFLGLT